MLWQLDRALRSINEPGFAGRIDEVREQIETLTLRDPDIAIYLTVRQDPKRLTIYALAHSVHCALVALLMARRLGWDEPRTRTLMRAALTMNVAILDLQGRMAAQGAPPTPPQMEMIRAHPGVGVKMLQAAGVADDAWLAAVADHHERADGSGYPQGLREVGELATVLRYIDVFMAKMAPRAARRAPAAAAGCEAALPGKRWRQRCGGDHQGVRHLPAGRVRAAQVRRARGGGSPQRRCTHAAGRQRDRPPRHAACQHRAARHGEGRVRDHRHRVRVEVRAAHAAGAAVRVAGMRPAPQALP
ncbi:hypothetical protein FSC37_02870 [Piscinibacter aquaticus]|uniref:HD domain-containing protein n=1 Tax=Piscinibacter aquaticus TaxID=392597 RepID=A0A5C6TXX8_9BURK|nr:hypothetical protein FSC37_02870 [Piscinibacter aquaticus]